MAKRDDLAFYNVDKAYVDYLSPQAPHLFRNSKASQAHSRKYIGVVLRAGSFLLCPRFVEGGRGCGGAGVVQYSLRGYEQRSAQQWRLRVAAGLAGLALEERFSFNMWF